MLTSIKRFFEDHISIEPVQSGSSGEEESVALAVCALLLEMAHIDGEFTGEEMRDIVNLVKEEFHLEPEEIEELIVLAERQREERIDLWQFTRLIHDRCDAEEKKRILKTLWSVVYSDGILEAHEDYLMHKLAGVLELSHRDLIEAKLRVLEERRG